MVKRAKIVCLIATAGAVFLPAAQATLSDADTRFINAAASGTLLEVRLGQYAAQNADSNDVKTFGQAMVEDHNWANNRLSDLAANEPIHIPQQMSEGDKEILHRLEQLKGAKFDKAYMSQVVRDHQNDIAYFDIEAADGSNSRAKDAAKKILPVLKRDLKKAEELNRRFGA